VPPPPRPASRLERWANDPAKRIWLIAGGGLLLLIGLLPPARIRQRVLRGQSPRALP